MKKLIILLSALLILCPKSFAQSDNIAFLDQKGFFTKPSSCLSPYDEVKRTMLLHLKYANGYNINGLKTLYADNYMNSDGLNKSIYFDLIKKTWESYPDIRYRSEIKSIDVNGNTAVVQVIENATATTQSKSGILDENGLLESISNSVYYLEKTNNEWLITTDHIITEKTFLKYGSAKTIFVDLNAPCQIPAGTQYTSTFAIDQPKNSLIIASIGKENITYPQSTAEEVFRKLPNDGVLERVFTSNKDNINEYTVASYGITQAEMGKGPELKIYVTGLGFIMSRVNVIPKNDFIKAADNDKQK